MIATGIKRVQEEKQLGAWFDQLFPLVQTRDSCNPDMAVDSSSSLHLSDGDITRKRASDSMDIIVDIFLFHDFIDDHLHLYSI